MEANELRIGNLLYFKNTDMVAKVQLINAPKHFDCRDEFGVFVPNGEYEPIPLTEEWLLKFGFDVLNNNTEWKICDKYSILYYVNGYRLQAETVLGSYTVCKLKHVHQLMNLYFALTGKELTTK